MTTALEQQRIDAELGAAWRHAEEALPEGWELSSLRNVGNLSWNALARNGGQFFGGVGATPAAALDDLALGLAARQDGA